MLPPRPPPISKLPVELLSIIFVLSREPEDDDPGSFDTGSVKTPLILSHVSRHWRNIARNIPRLWTQICVSWDLFIEDDGSSGPRIETNLIASYLALSKNCPLDIRIDVRDEDWDGTEPEIEYDDPDYDPASISTGTYHPDRLLVACSLITNLLPLLVPHLHRWGSLGILTDTWAPMFIALNLINPSLTTFGAPRLESLTLMRCNGYVCFNPMFEPKRLVKPEFLSRETLGDDANSVLNDGSAVNPLPGLKHLALMGVHVDWDALANAMETNEVGGLETLSLRSLSKQVTPSRVAFLRLLHASPNMESLVVNTAGPSSLSDSDEHDGLGRARLNKLQMLEIGYRSEEEAEALLGSISTSTAREVVLKYEEYIPGEVENMDGELVLGYLAKTEAEGQRPLVLSDVEELRLSGVGFEDELMGREALKTVLAGAKRLKRLNVVDMAVEDVLRSLIPEGTRHPCPELQSLTMKLRPSFQYTVVSNACIPVWMEMVTHLLGERRKTSTLKEVIIEVESFAPDFVGRDKATIGETFVSISVSKASVLDSTQSACALGSAQ